MPLVASERRVQGQHGGEEDCPARPPDAVHPAGEQRDQSPIGAHHVEPLHLACHRGVKQEAPRSEQQSRRGEQAGAERDRTRECERAHEHIGEVRPRVERPLDDRSSLERDTAITPLAVLRAVTRREPSPRSGLRLNGHESRETQRHDGGDRECAR